MKKNKEKIKTVSIKYIPILNRQSSHYHNKRLPPLVRLNCHYCFRDFACPCCNLCICKHQYKACHLLCTIIFGSIPCMDTLETPVPTT